MLRKVSKFHDHGRELEKVIRAAVNKAANPFAGKVTHLQIVDALLTVAQSYAGYGLLAEEEEEKKR